MFPQTEMWNMFTALLNFWYAWLATFMNFLTAIFTSQGTMKLIFVMIVVWIIVLATKSLASWNLSNIFKGITSFGGSRK